jgi:hypothetical protein
MDQEARQISIALNFCSGIYSLSLSLSFFFFQYQGLNSGHTPWATLPALFVLGVFEIRFRELIYQGWLPTMILLISASWVAKIIGISLQHWASFNTLKTPARYYYCCYTKVTQPASAQVGAILSAPYTFVLGIQHCHNSLRATDIPQSLTGAPTYNGGSCVCKTKCSSKDSDHSHTGNHGFREEDWAPTSATTCLSRSPWKQTGWTSLLPSVAWEECLSLPLPQ